MAKKPEYRDLFPGALELRTLKNLNGKPPHAYALAQRHKDISGDHLLIEEGGLVARAARMLKAGVGSKPRWASRPAIAPSESSK